MQKAARTARAVYSRILGKGRLVPILVLASLLLTVVMVAAISTQRAHAATNSTINFQARVLTASGSIIPDGNVNIQFKLYDASSGGNNPWTETQITPAKNGYVTVSLGSVTPFPGTIDWSQELWITLNINGDGEMGPTRMKVTGVPYSFRSGQADSLTNGTGTLSASSLAQLSPLSVQNTNSAIASLRLNQQGAGGILQLQGSGSDVFTVSNSGNTSIYGSFLAKNSTNSVAAFEVQDSGGTSYLKVNTLGGTAVFGAGGSTLTTLQGGSGGVQITSGANVNIGQADTNGTLLVIDTKTTDTDPAGTNGAIYYNSFNNKFRCYQNDTWMDCVAGAPYEGTSASFVGGVQNLLSNQTAFPIENMVFTSSVAISNIAAVGGYTAPADGSFRSCLVMNNANITAGTLALRWRVNGASVGSPVCQMNATTNRQASSVINPGVVTFSAGDVIDLAFDTSAAFLPSGSNDFTVYWGVEYVASGGGSAAGGVTLQNVYDQSLVASMQSANNKNITFNLTNTAIDSDFVVNVESGSTSRLVVQDNGSDTFSVNATGDVTAAGGVTIGNSSSTTAGTIRWTGTDFEGFNGANWISLSSSGSGSSGVNIVSLVKQTNESIISNNVLQDDNELTFAIGPNEEWSYRFVVQANSGTTPDLQFAVSAPGGATCQVGYSDAEGATAIGQIGCGVTTGTIAGNGAVDTYEIVGTVKNGVTAGNVTLRWAQFTSNATNTIVYAGSYLQAIRSIGAGGNGQPFAQGGNSFGATAVLGTSDNNALAVISNGLERLSVTSSGNVGIGDTTPAALFTVGTNDALQINSTGDVLTSGSLTVNGLSTIGGNLVAKGLASGVTASTEAVQRANVTTINLTGAAFANNDVIRINNAGQDYYTRIVSGGGTATLTVSPAVSYDASATLERYSVQNIGATATDYASESNRFYQGYFLGGVVVGAGSTTISDGNISSSGPLRLQQNGGDLIIGGALSISGTISGNGSGLTNIDGSNISAGSIEDTSLSSNVTLLGNTFNGLSQLLQLDTNGYIPALNGSALTTLNAANISSGTLDNARLNSNVTKLGNTVNSIDGLVQLDSSGHLPALNGSALTSLNASNIASGSLGDSYLSTNITKLGNTFNGISQLVQLDGSGNLPILNGGALTSLNASNLSSGTVNDLRLSSNVTLAGNTFNGVNNLVKLDGSGYLPTLNGSALTSLDASNLSSGTVNDLRLSSNVTLMSNSFNGADQLLKLDGSGYLPSLNASALTSLNGSNISSGTVADDRLTSNVAILNRATQSFSGKNSFSDNVAIGATANANNKLQINTPNTADNSAQEIIYTNAIANKGLVIQMVAGQNVNAFEVQNNNGVALGGFDKSGQLILGNDAAAPQAGLIAFNDASGANGFSAVLGVNTLTASRNIYLPDEAGTLCIRSSANCGFIQLGPSTIQADATTNPSIFINKSGATGNIITLQDNGANAFLVGNDGALQILSTNTGALNISNASGSNFFNVDTSGGIVRIGGASADSSGVILVLDIKNTAGDPTGQEGAMYYNSASGNFKCYQNSRGWTDCLGIPKPNTRRNTQITYMGSGTVFTGLGDIITSGGAGGTLSSIAATNTEPTMINHATANASGNYLGISGNTNYNTSSNPSYQTYVQLTATTTERLWAGVTSATQAVMSASNNPAGNFAAFRYDTATDGTTWRCVVKDGTTITPNPTNNTGVTVTTAGVDLEIILSGTNAAFKINGVEVCNLTSNLPAPNTNLRYVNSITNLANGVRNMRIGWVYLDSDK